jgi:hypothetical protein
MDLTQYNDGQAYTGEGIAHNNDFQPIPPGEYPVEVKDACVKTTRKGNGAYVEIVFEVCGPDCNGRRLWFRCNIANPNPKAVEIGKEQLDSVRIAAGLVAMTDTDQLLGAQMTAKVIVDSENRNEVKYVKAYEAPRALPPAPPTMQAAPVPAPQQAPPAPAPQAAPQMPWQQPTAPPPPQPGAYADTQF